MITYYKLDDNNEPIVCSLTEWGDLYRTKDGNERRQVGYDEVGEYEISTVFSGVDSNYGLTEKPMLFETMIFGPGVDDRYKNQCATWKEAEEMHKRAIQWATDRCKEV